MAVCNCLSNINVECIFDNWTDDERKLGKNFKRQRTLIQLGSGSLGLGEAVEVSLSKFTILNPKIYRGLPKKKSPPI